MLSALETQRTNQARQRLYRKQKNPDTINDKASTQATISEDLADGQTTTLDASLKLLSEENPKLVLPNDLEDDQIHFVGEAPPGERQDENHALQDYQMQLMLLEQQNKKRLLLARQEQDQEQGPDRRSASPFNEVAAAKELKRRYREGTGEKEQAETGQTLRLSRDLKALQVKLKMPAAYADESTGPTKKRQKRGTAPPSKASQISCDESSTGVHAARVFRDAPGVTEATELPKKMGIPRAHLSGTKPVVDMQAFMENDKDGIAFVAIRTVQCSEASVLMARTDGSLRWTEAIYTKSKLLKRAMQKVATCHFQPVTGTKEESFERNRIVPADLFLFHHRDLLRNHAIEQPETKQHIEALLRYADKRFGIEFVEADSLFAGDLVDQEHLLQLFKPNELVTSGTYDKHTAFVLQDWPVMDSSGWVTLTCWSFQTDGRGFARKQSKLSIFPIEAKTMAIRNLAAYPLKFATKELQELIRRRGEKYWDHRNAKQITYKGWNVARDQFFPDARFMIDHKMYLKMHEFAKAFLFDKPERTHSFDRLPAYLTVEAKPSEMSFLLMPPELHGFYLNEKKWIKIFVDDIHPVMWNTKAFERLVLPEPTKNLVEALVKVRTSQKGIKQGLGVAGKRTDITSGKGNGLIMLLHGGPGTGKTLTAESVAEIAEMPLYRVTCGDVGTNPEAVERYLNTVLHLGKIWNCVLLLDEADVFLEERSMSDLKRNSLVSVFLRILEYYDGLLILTSNRVGMFDEAFKSRIQVALHYENLNRSDRKKIWQNFLDMLEEDEEDVNFDEIRLRLNDLAGKEINGRQIRNVLTTARQLAMFMNERLDYPHLEQALAVSSDFSEYLKRMQGHTDDQRARDTALR
ncbi:hypothetical protein Q9189_004965 [Teloschistes chrysophthalmus]